MKNPNPKHDWRPGDTCFFLANWSGAVTRARISEIHDDAEPYARLSCQEPAPGDTCRHLDELFQTRKDAETAAVSASNSRRKAFESQIQTVEVSASNSRRKAFESQIQTVEDLVRFDFEHCVCQAEEYTDWDAREAYKNRARSLLNMDL